MANTVIVTGGSRGIGRSIAKRLAVDGFSVVVGYGGNSQDADDTTKEILSAGGKAIPVAGDISQPDSVATLFATATEEFGPIHAVVNCAGIMPLFPISKGDVEAFDKVIATNLRGAFLVLSQAARDVVEGGRIIALSSSMIGKSFPNYGAYVASKSGVEGLVRVLANEMRGRNISVNVVAPGPTATDLFIKGKTDAQIEEFKKLNPLERLGQPEDISNLVSFLVGPEGGWINGQIVRANGGFA